MHRGLEAVLYEVKHDTYYKDKKKPIFNISKETLTSFYIGWATSKLSPWKNMLYNHIGIIWQVNHICCVFQAGINEKPRRVLFSGQENQAMGVDEIEKFQLDHVILHFSGLIVGWAFACLMLIAEICWAKKMNKYILSH